MYGGIASSHFCRAIDLVSGERVKIAARLLDVGFFVNAPLRAVHEHRNVVSVSYLDNFSNRVYKA